MNEDQGSGTPPPAPPQQEEVPAESHPPAAPAAKSGMSENTWAMACHLAALAGLMFPVVGHIGGPLVVWILKKDEMPLVDRHGKESLNFQISFAIYSVVATSVAAVLVLLLIGIILLPLVVLAIYAVLLVFPILAGLKANEGKWFEYPMTIRFIK